MQVGDLPRLPGQPSWQLARNRAQLRQAEAIVPARLRRTIGHTRARYDRMPTSQPGQVGWP
jgi:hypothetical protein